MKEGMEARVVLPEIDPSKIVFFEGLGMAWYNECAVAKIRLCPIGCILVEEERPGE
jgi:hypothetical protein